MAGLKRTLVWLNADPNDFIGRFRHTRFFAHAGTHVIVLIVSDIEGSSRD